MDDSIAPVEDDASSDPIADYRRYLEQNTGDRAPAPMPMGGGPSIDGTAGPVAPAAPQSAQIAPTGGGAAPNIPVAPSAPQAPAAPQARRVANVMQAPNAPVIGGPQAPAALPPGYGPGAAPPGGAPASSVDLGDQSQMTPASGHVVKGKKNDQGKPVVAVVPPDHDPDKFWDKDKLQNANNAQQLIAAVKPGQLSPYMDWWEQQHGDINQRYDQMRAELGERPDPNREPTRKEKFTELMNFGLQLMQNARRGADPTAAMGESIQQARGAQQAKQQGETATYDARAAGIEAQRQAQLKDLGNYGQATREDALIQNARTQQLKALQPPKQGEPYTRMLKDGTQVQYDQTDGTWKQSIGPGGKPLKPDPSVGPRGGVGGGRAPARMAEVQDLVSHGASYGDAVNKVYGVGKTLDPTKTYTGIYRSAISAGELPEAAQQEADAVTSKLHGANWQQQTQGGNKSIFHGTPPKVAPPPGKIGVDKDGNRWKNDGKGNAVPA